MTKTLDSLHLFHAQKQAFQQASGLIYRSINHGLSTINGDLLLIKIS
ncbi:hypothetical protein GECvBMG_gp200 [Salmonella phage GEC_vB_MG]|nr:hypothetical protein GECvBMG_gp200 [Salmonella phage GEC_vB_MG]